MTKQQVQEILKNLAFRILKKSMSNKELNADRARYEQLNTDTRFSTGKQHDYICRFDKYAQNGGIIDNQYFIQDIWGARKVYEHAPSVHYDVGSSVQGFIAHLLSQKQKIVLIDIRKMDNNFDTQFLREPRNVLMGGGLRQTTASFQIKSQTESKSKSKSESKLDSVILDSHSNFHSNSCGGIDYICADATNLEGIADNSVESLSALCSVEHFGLGRYGDPIAPNAWEQALRSFSRVLKPGGRLYFSVPIGQISKVCFNAHRVFHPSLIIETLDSLQLLEFGYIEGFDVIRTMWRENVDCALITDERGLERMPEMQNWGTTGLFEFIKPESK